MPIEMGGAPAFASRTSALLFFDGDGMEAPFDGFIVVEGEHIEGVTMRHSREGLTGDALTSEHLAAYRGLRTDGPIRVDAVSGATISSRRLNDAVNERVKTWRKATGLDEPPDPEEEEGR